MSAKATRGRQRDGGGIFSNFVIELRPLHRQKWPDQQKAEYRDSLKNGSTS